MCIRPLEKSLQQISCLSRVATTEKCIKSVMQELPADFLKLSLLLPLRLLKLRNNMSRRHVVSNLLGAFPLLSLRYPALHFFLFLFYLNMRSVCIAMISDFQTLKGFV